MSCVVSGKYIFTFTPLSLQNCLLWAALQDGCDAEITAGDEFRQTLAAIQQIPKTLTYEANGKFGKVLIFNDYLSCKFTVSQKHKNDTDTK